MNKILPQIMLMALRENLVTIEVMITFLNRNNLITNYSILRLYVPC